MTKKYKNQYQFYFLIGADQLNNIERWYKIDQLTKLFQFVCFKRPGYIINEKLAQNTIFLSLMVNKLMLLVQKFVQGIMMKLMNPFNNISKSMNYI